MPRPIGARNQTSRSSAVVRITGIALVWTDPTTAFGSVVRKPQRSAVISPSLIFRMPVHVVHGSAKKVKGSSGGARWRLAEAGERHQAPVLRAEPTLPVPAGGVADVRHALVGLQSQESLKVDRLAFRLQLGRPLLRRLYLHDLRCWLPSRRRMALCRMASAAG